METDRQAGETTRTNRKRQKELKNKTKGKGRSARVLILQERNGGSGPFQPAPSLAVVIRETGDKKPSSPRVVGERGPRLQGERVNRSPKHFLVRSRGLPAAVARSSAHMKLRNASAVGENQAAAMHGGRRRARLLWKALFFPRFCLSSHYTSLFIQPPLVSYFHILLILLQRAKLSSVRSFCSGINWCCGHFSDWNLKQEAAS